jgi:two-component system, NarL family, nitrate/nitrite response regulator NarL
MNRQEPYTADADGVEVITSIVVRSPILREGLKKLLTDAGFSVYCENRTRDETRIIEAMRDRGADLVILDGSLCEAPSQLVVALRQAVPGARIVIMTARDSVNRIADESLTVADGILSSETSIETMILSLRLIRLGSQVVTPDLHIHLLPGSKFGNRSDPSRPSENSEPAPAEQLPSPRETEILHYLTVGCSNKTIALKLGIAEATVKVHLKALLRKIRVANRTQAAIWAMNNGIGEPARRP